MNMIKTRLNVIFVLLLFLVSMVPVMAEGSQVMSNTRGGASNSKASETDAANGTTAVDSSTADSSDTTTTKTVKATETSATDAAQVRSRILERRVFANLNETEQAKLMELNTERIEKLEQFEASDLKTIASLPASRIRAITKIEPEQLRLIKGLDKQDIKKLAYLDSARLKEIMGAKSISSIRRELTQYELKHVNEEKQFKERDVTEEDAAEAEEAYKTAEGKFNEEKTRFNEERRLFNEARAAKNEIAALEHAKNYLSHTANLIIAMLERVKEKVNANDDLTDAEAADMVAKIDARIQEMTDAKAKVEAAATKEEVKESGNVILKTWKNIKKEIKEYVAKLVQTKVGEIVERSEQLEKKLDKTLADMEAQGIDVAGIDEKVSLFSLRINEARTKYKESVELFEQAKNIRETNPKTAAELVKQSRVMATEAHSALKEAHNILKEIVRDVKEAGGELKEVDDNENYEVVAAAEETTEASTPAEE